MSKNAFLDIHAYPLDWSKLTVDKLPAALDEGLKTSWRQLRALEKLPLEKVSYKTFFTDGLDLLGEELSQAWGLLHHLASVNDSPQLRKIKKNYLKKIVSFYAAIDLSPKLWERIRKLESSNEAKRLLPLEKRHLKLTAKGFRLSGAELGPTAKKEYLAIRKELSSLSNDFSQRVLDATNAFEKSFPPGSEKTLLRGLPKSALEAARASAKSKGKSGYRFTLQQPSLTAILEKADDPALRKEFYEASQQIGRQKPFDTLPLIKRMLQLRQKKAQLLGFKSHAHLRLTDRMLDTPAKVRSFLLKILRRARPAVLRDFKKIAALKAGQLEPWDISYYEEKLYKKALSFDSNSLKPYFEYQHVLKSLYGLCERLYGIKIKKKAGHKTWHSQVEYFEVFKGNKLLGGFYTDFFPRESKQAGAWHLSLRMGRPLSDGSHTPVIANIVGNLNPPSYKAPSLLSPDNVHTLYHEFGHLMHNLLSTVPITGLSGTQVARDFVELPSQLMENYYYHPDYLRLLARHYKTGRPLDKKTIEKIGDSQKFLKSLRTNHIAAHSLFDLELHASPKPPKDIEKFVDKICKPYRLPFKTYSYTRLRKFSHLWSLAYDTGYYSYLWCNILEADVWEFFKRSGILSGKTGHKFWKEILSRGNSEPPDKLYKNMMGRAPRLEPFLRRIR